VPSASIHAGGGWLYPGEPAGLFEKVTAAPVAASGSASCGAFSGPLPQPAV